MYTITYSLIENSGESDAFYQKLSAFTDEVLAEMKNLTGSIADGYIFFRKNYGTASLCSSEEVGFELLVLSTLWEVLNSDTGIVGVACVLNLVSGGWPLDSMGIPAQCVLLDYCGCRNHWSREGIPTGINMEQLKRVLGIE